MGNQNQGEANASHHTGSGQVCKDEKYSCLSILLLTASGSEWEMLLHVLLRSSEAGRFRVESHPRRSRHDSFLSFDGFHRGSCVRTVKACLCASLLIDNIKCYWCFRMELGELVE